jgi:hypothetical protein
MAGDLELDEAMRERDDRCQIFDRFHRERLFDQSLTDAEFVDGLWLRQEALERATEHLLALLESRKDKR